MRHMSKNRSTDSGRKDFLQFRVPTDEKRGAELVAKIEKISQSNGLSLNDVANMALAAGLNMVETKLREIHEPAEKAA